MSQTIEIIVQPDGQTRLQTQGFTGSQCRQASQFLEEALGKRTSEELTSEFYQSQSTQENVQENA